MLHHVPKVLFPVVAGRMECIDHHHIIGSLFGRFVICDVSHYPVGLASHFEQRTSKPRFKIHDENRIQNSEATPLPAYTMSNGLGQTSYTQYRCNECHDRESIIFRLRMHAYRYLVLLL